MSKYTTEVRFICEQACGLTESVGYSSVKNVLAQAAPKVFDFEFPIFDEAYRLPLEIKILRHYYTREISEETVGLWKLRLEDRMNVIMPYYNQLYKSELLSFNPLYDVDLIRDHTTKTDSEANRTEDRNGHDTLKQDISGTANTTSNQDETGTRSDIGHTNTKGTSDTTNESESNGQRDDTEHTNTKGSSDTTSKSTTNEAQDSTQNVDATNQETVNKNGTAWKLYSDTPQGGIDGIQRATDDIVQNAYLTNATKDTEDTTTTTTGSSGTNTTANRSTDTTMNGSAQATSTEDEQSTFNSKTTDTYNGTSVTNDTTDTQDTLESNTTANTTANSDTTTTQNSTSDRFSTDNIIGNDKLTSTEDYLEHVRGKQGTASYSKLLNEFRQTFLNIDAMLLDNLSDLFFGLW